MVALFEALLNVTLPPRCGACEAPLAVRTSCGLCPLCHELIELNAGPRCRRCDLPTDEQEICDRCRSETLAFEGLRAPFVYGGVVRDLVLRAKFRGREDLADTLGALLASHADELRPPEAPACVTPVPLALGRRLRRGYNPSAVLARALAKALGLEVHHLLRRPRATKSQSGLSLAERRTNVRAAFVSRRRVAGAICLVDDVATSGATAHHAALALKHAGASSVWVVALARSLEQ